MKKIFCIFFAMAMLVLTFAFTGCKDGKDSGKDNGTDNEVVVPFPDEWMTDN